MPSAMLDMHILTLTMRSQTLLTLITFILLSCLLTTLDAVVGPRFTHSPEPIIAPTGDSAEFECSLDVPAEKIRWRHNRKFLSYTEHNITKSRLFVQVKNGSQGEYQCVAWYGVSALASTPARLSLAMFELSTAAFNRQLTVTQGNTLLINCSVPKSNPLPGIQYYKNDRPLPGGQVLASGALLLTNVTPADSGQYSCSAINTYVKSDPQFIPSYHNLNVVPVQQDSRQSPQFTFTPASEYKIQVGNDVTLECVAFGEPVPKVRWRKENGALPFPQERSQVTGAGLRITNVVPSDEGVYICDFSNSVGGPLIHRIMLSVLEPPTVVRGPAEREVNEGGRASLECTVKGKPNPAVHWLLNGLQIHNESKVHVYGNRLELEKVEKRHAGWYQCMVQNVVGSAFGASQLLVVPRQVTFNASNGHSHHPRPSARQKGKKNKVMVPPSKPAVTQLDESSVMVRWEKPSNSGLEIQFFKVQYREMKRTKDWMTDSEEIKAHIQAYEISHLTPDSAYKFRIAAVYSNNDNQIGPTSKKLHLNSEVKPSQVPPTPRLTSLIPAGPDSIQISWECHPTSAAIEGFYLYYRSTSSAGEYLKAAVEGERVRSHTVRYLDSESPVEFKIRSFNQDAASDFSEIRTQRTERPSTISPPSAEATPPTHVEIDEGSRGGQQLYVTLGAVLGGLALLLALCTWIFCCNKHRQHHSTSTDDDDVDKSRHIQMEAIHVNGHVAGHVNGPRDSSMLVSKTTATANGCCSKMNITSNPLDPEESKTQNVMEIAFITTNSCGDDNCSSSVLTARLASAAVLPTCAMESESWRRPDIPRTVDNYV